VLLQPIKAAASQVRQPRPVLPTSNTYTDVESTSTDMTSDDDASNESSDSSGTGGNDLTAANNVVPQMPNGGSFDVAFADINIGQQ